MCVLCVFLIIWLSLNWLQRYDLEEGTDPCVFYTQLTKLLNLIALLGIFPSCGKSVFFFFFKLINGCENDVFSSIQKGDSFWSNAASWLLRRMKLMIEMIESVCKKSCENSVEKKLWGCLCDKNSDSFELKIWKVCSMSEAWAPVFLLAGLLIDWNQCHWTATAKTTYLIVCKKKSM